MNGLIITIASLVLASSLSLVSPQAIGGTNPPAATAATQPAATGDAGDQFLGPPPFVEYEDQPCTGC